MNQTTTRRRRRLRRTRRWDSARALIAAGALLIAGFGVSSAALTDRANLNLGEDGIGFSGVFDIAVIRPDGLVEQATEPAGYDWVVTGAERLVPGHEITTDVSLFNNTDRLAADVTFSIVLRNGDGTVAPGVPNIAPLLRFSAQDASGDPLFTGVTWEQASASLGTLGARGLDPLSAGEAYTPGASGSDTSFTLTISYPDAPGVEDYNGGQAAIGIRFHASSVTP
ncbi:hypothetical protein [Microbacterium sp. SORGH_AS_0862]|uniref:hypothetical protein n=1 Tax=Microbacterium sp. SORGH_AS_0862 TaxID=3041789 RepID=UPI002792CEC8|nr:hypothetical protein [Microbacterium sp. SORGH_AS_0862]MDQ1205231.1 hypothetical protein [Microbacterium sp. SORGH_AS_0862]